ncbi:MAG: hypothetical protein ACTSQJ_03985 [Promethearchaeota archaeon]
MNKDNKKERNPIYMSISDVKRSFKKVQEFQRLIEKGKTPEQIFKDMLKLIFIEK